MTTTSHNMILEDMMSNPTPTLPPTQKQKSKSLVKALPQKDKGTCKLKQYLEGKKKLALAGPPPTQTTNILQSYLDGKDGKKHVRTKRRRSITSTNASAHTSDVRRKMMKIKKEAALRNADICGKNMVACKKVIKRQPAKTKVERKADADAKSKSVQKKSNNMWANINVNVIESENKLDRKGSVFSSGTLDDLLAHSSSSILSPSSTKRQMKPIASVCKRATKNAKSNRISRTANEIDKPIDVNSNVKLSSASTKVKAKEMERRSNYNQSISKVTSSKTSEKDTKPQCSFSSPNNNTNDTEPNFLKNKQDESHNNSLQQIPLSKQKTWPNQKQQLKEQLPLPEIKTKSILMSVPKNKPRFGNRFKQETRRRHLMVDRERMNSSTAPTLLLSSSTSQSISEKSQNQNSQNNNHDTSSSSNAIPTLTAQNSHEHIFPKVIEPILPSINNKFPYPSSNISTKQQPPPQTNSITILSNRNETTTHSKKINTKKQKTKDKNVNDNFVRLNLRNNAGSCRGARNLRNHNRQKRWKAKRREEYRDKFYSKERNGKTIKGIEGGDDEDNSNNDTSQTKGRQMNSIHDAIDPIDDYLDGTFHKKVPTKTKNHPSTQQTSQGNSQKEPIKQRTTQHPLCTRHNRQCKLLVVKKNTTGNKGRKFYVCSMPKGEQCDFFQWEDDTIESTKNVLLESSTQSGFIARQVASHIDRFKTLTVPELRSIAKKKKLNHSGKKGVLIARLSVWVRDELCKDRNDLDKDVRSEFEDTTSLHLDGLDYDSDGSSEDDISTSSEELEICGMEESSSSCEKPNTHSSDSVGSNLRETKPALHQSLYDLFGYSSFRDGQEWAIKRCLAHKRTLLVAPTGMGKSLCYALPAALMDGVCIVVSPLISLIDDQLRHLPPRIPSASLSGNISKKNMALLIDDLINSRIKILFVSPEKLTSAAFRRLLRPKFNIEKKIYERQLPPVSLLCLDEAHCLSQWGHNFRSSYLRIRAIMDSLSPKSVLALTATAGQAVVEDICRTLRISNCTDLSNDDSNTSVKVLSCNRDNIDVSAVFVPNEDQKLQMLLKLMQEPLERRTSVNFPTNNYVFDKMEGHLSKGSVIVYVWRKKDAEIIAEQLQASGLSGGVVCYHGGMDAGARAKAQSKFMRGKARVCVATVAFGLGINKSDVKAVVHLCLPSSPENYLQEIGRAGRDGSNAQAVALVAENEIAQKHSLSFSNRISTSQVKTFLSIIQYLTNEARKDIPLDRDDIVSLNVAIAVAPIIKAVDMKEETILTILSMLEDETTNFSKMLDIQGVIPDIATVTLKLRSLEELATVELLGRCILTCGKLIDARSRNSSKGGTAMQSGFGAYSFGTVQFSVTQCSRLLGPTAEPRNVYAALRRLQSNGEIELSFDNHDGRSIFFKMNEEGLLYFNNNEHNTDSSTYDSTKQSLDDLRDSICECFSQQDVTQCDKVLSMQNILQKMSSMNTEEYEPEDSLISQRLEAFQGMIEDYFEKDESIYFNSKNIIQEIDEEDTTTLQFLTTDVLTLYQDKSLSTSCPHFPQQVKFGIDEYFDYTALLITKILHGISSPSTPSLNWYSHHLWGKWKSYNFLAVLSHVTNIISH